MSNEKVETRKVCRRLLGKRTRKEAFVRGANDGFQITLAKKKSVRDNVRTDLSFAIAAMV